MLFEENLVLGPPDAVDHAAERVVLGHHPVGNQPAMTPLRPDQKLHLAFVPNLQTIRSRTPALELLLRRFHGEDAHGPAHEFHHRPTSVARTVSSNTNRSLTLMSSFSIAFASTTWALAEDRQAQNQSSCHEPPSVTG